MQQRILNILFPLTTFLGAFLLFAVQPLIGKYILPWFGGTPAVWTTCMLFFQTMLLVGYLYAHASVRYLSPRVQGTVHVILLLIAVCLLPIIPAERWVPNDPNYPMLRVLGLLTVSVGVPYLALAGTAPLLQGWFARVRSGKSPYRLYALSNTASMLALLSYPFIFEPNLTRTTQAWTWSYALVAFAVICAALAFTVAFKSGTATSSPIDSNALHAEASRAKVNTKVLAGWIILPMLASAMLLAVTNKICQDVAVIPLLWIVPLAIYLLTFIICFDNPRWYVRRTFIALLALSTMLAVWTMLPNVPTPGALITIAIFCTLLFIACMVYHGELFRLRPGQDHLTLYYVMISAGGALGGLSVAVIAPLVFKTFFEIYLGLLFGMLLALYLLWVDLPDRDSAPRRIIFGGLAVLMVGVFLWAPIIQSRGVVTRARNFYGVLSVIDVNEPDRLAARTLVHGGITHGVQIRDPEHRSLPTTYYGLNSGVAVALGLAPRSNGTIKVGAVGLGAGTVATYAKPGDLYKFYEINPAVIQMASVYFTFLHDCPGQVEIVPGDARMSLKRQIDSEQFDLLILDAFSGDAIPVHLLTKECFEIYLHHLRKGALIAVHISNMYLDLAPVVLKLADHFKLHAVVLSSLSVPENWVLESRWVLMTEEDNLLDAPAIRDAHPQTLNSQATQSRLWTDDDTNIFELLVTRSKTVSGDFP